MDQARLRTLKVKAEENGKIVNDIIDGLVGKYGRELEQTVTSIRDALNSNRDVSDEELERWVMELPVLLYFAGTGIERLGAEGDSAKAIKMAAYNEALEKATGTVAEKKGYAETKSFDEYLVDIAFARAYKRLKNNIYMAELLHGSAKKILSKRVEEFTLTRRDTNA